MATKLLSLYFLVIAGLGVVRTGTSASYCPIRAVHWFVDGVREIAPLILDQRQEGSNGELGQLPSNQLGKIFNATDFPVNVMSVAVKRAGTSESASQGPIHPIR